MLRIILGLSLLLTVCPSIDSASSWRYVRQILPEEAPEVPVAQDKLNANESNKEEVINNVINKTTNRNDSAKSSLRISVDNKLKTENETQKQAKHINNSKVNKEGEEYEYSNEEDSETSQTNHKKQTTTGVPDTKHTVTFREESARSIDINKYISPEFHNKNQVYTLAISPDTEKYINLHNDITFSTTSRYDFDKKQKDIETEVKHKLKYIDSEFSQAEKDFHSNTRNEGELDVSEILEKPLDNNTNAELQFLKYKNITSSYNKINNKINKETDIEAGQTVNYNTSYNKTHIYNETPKDYKNKISTHDEEFVDTKFSHKFITEPVDNKKTNIDTENTKEPLTQKDTSLTKPPSLNKTSNQEHLISNKIETDITNVENVLKTKNSFLDSTTQPSLPSSKITTHTTVPKRVQQYTTLSYDQNEKETIAISKRGSTKYADTIIPTASTTAMPRTRTPSRVNNKQNLANKQNHTFEEVVQENQVYPVQVPAPTIDVNFDKNITEDTTVQEYLMTQTTLYTILDETTSTVPLETTTKLDTTTTFETTTENSKFTTMTIAQTTTELDTTTMGLTTNVNIVTLTDTETSTTPTTESITEIYSERHEQNFTTDMPYTADLFKNDHVSKTELDGKFTNGQEFNVSTISVHQTETDAVTNKNILPRTTTSQKINESTQVYSTTAEIVPTTSDYRENIIIKQTDILTTKQANVTKPPKIHEGQKSIFNETKIENKTVTIFYNTTETNTHTRIHAKTTDSPLIIPLNISIYETEPEITTNSQFIENTDENNSGKIAAIVISSIGAVCLVLLAGLLFVMRKRHKRFNYGQRCTPVSLDAYSVDNVSVYNSVRRKAAMRASKRSYGNPAFDDPTSTSNPLNFPALAKFANNANAIALEFEEIPQVTAQTIELPEGCEIKNRYANVIPLPETRVQLLGSIEGYPNSDYINANYVTGPKSTKNYYIACQAPMQNTVEDFWRMVWEQQSKVILMLTHLFENGSEKSIDYLPPSEVLDCHRLFGDFQITLKKREVKEKYVISILQLKNMVSNSWREVTHLWYLGWPEKGVPSEANSLIAFLIEARSYIKALPATENGKPSSNSNEQVANGSANVEHNPIIVHCSPGTGRTGTVIACDIAIREFELSRQVDIPKTVYRIRRDRASSVQTKEQYAFIYNVITLYATKLTGGVLDSL